MHVPVPPRELLSVEELSRITDKQVEGMRFWQARDIDAGEVDWELDRSLASYNLYEYLNKKALSAEDLILGLNLVNYGDHKEFIRAREQLLDDDLFSPGERKAVAHLIGSLIGKAPQVGKLFPGELSEAVKFSYGESVANVMFSVIALKRGDDLPDRLPLKGGSEVKLGEISFDEALLTIAQTSIAIDRIVSAARPDEPVERVRPPRPEISKIGMYKLGEGQDVLATVRLLATSQYDPEIEYGNRNGTQASIGYTTQEYGGSISEFKGEQKSPFSIRIDNEDDKLGFDIGSILGAEGSLGKRIADLIAIGDVYRTEIRGDKELTLNHNSSQFIHRGYEDRETFAVIASKKAAEFEKRATATELSRLGLGQRAGA